MTPGNPTPAFDTLAPAHHFLLLSAAVIRPSQLGSDKKVNLATAASKQEKKPREKACTCFNLLQKPGALNACCFSTPSLQRIGKLVTRIVS